MNNIEEHGYKVETYFVDENFASHISEIKKKIAKKPDIILFILHIQGIPNGLVEFIPELLSKNKQLIIIEDSVHRLLPPEKVNILNKRHFIITSLRKVTPFTGGIIFGMKGTLPTRKQVKTTTKARTYANTTLFLHNIFQALLTFGYTRRINLIVRVAERMLSIHNDLIGNSKLAGTISNKYISNYLWLNFQYIEKMKDSQAQMYIAKLSTIDHDSFEVILPEVSEYKYLRGVSVTILEPVAANFLKFLRENHVYAKYQLDDCEWSQNRKLLLLPIGPFITDNEIAELCLLIEKFFTKKNDVIK